MNDYEQRIKTLEDKVKILEETLETLKNMQMSEQMEGYIQKRTKTLRMAELINSLSDQPGLDLSKEQDAVREIQAQKRSVDEQIASAINSSINYSEECATDLKYFEYEIENGIGDYKRPLQELSEYIGKGIRITAYNGFDCESIIIPKEIDGLPVTSIGENAFKNATFNDIVMPDTIKAILCMAFYGCKNLTEIELPKELIYLGHFAFQSSGLHHVTIPNNVTVIEDWCFCYCEDLMSVTFGNKLLRIGERAFDHTKVKTYIFPENVQTISYDAFCNGYMQIDVECVFLGKYTNVVDGSSGLYQNVKTIYCLPGSNAQKFAREWNIPIKPLSEFKAED